MKKTVSFLSLFLTFIFSLFSQNLISTKALNINEVKCLTVDLTYEKIEFSPIYGNEIVIDLYANNNHMLPSISLDQNEEGRGCLSLKTSTKGNNATSGDICKISVYIPYEAFFDSITINLTNPNFILDSVKAKDVLIIDRGKEKGRIDVINSNISSLNIMSSSSFINIQNIKSEYIKTNTKDSEIALKNIASDYFDVESKNGIITASLISVPYATSTIKSENGTIELFVPKENEGFTLNVHSNKGSLNNKIDKKKLSPRLGYEKSYNEGGAIIYLVTTNSDITVSDY